MPSTNIEEANTEQHLQPQRPALAEHPDIVSVGSVIRHRFMGAGDRQFREQFPVGDFPHPVGVVPLAAGVSGVNPVVGLMPGRCVWSIWTVKLQVELHNILFICHLVPIEMNGYNYDNRF